MSVTRPARRLHRVGLVRCRRADAEIELALCFGGLERGVGQRRDLEFGAGRHRDAAGGDLDHRLCVRLGPERVALDDGKVQRRRVPLVVVLGVERNRAADLRQPAHARRRIAALLVLCSRRPQRWRRALRHRRLRQHLRQQQRGDRHGRGQAEPRVLRAHS